MDAQTCFSITEIRQILELSGVDTFRRIKAVKRFIAEYYIQQGHKRGREVQIPALVWLQFFENNYPYLLRFEAYRERMRDEQRSYDCAELARITNAKERTLRAWFAETTRFAKRLSADEVKIVLRQKCEFLYRFKKYLLDQGILKPEETAKNAEGVA